MRSPTRTQARLAEAQAASARLAAAEAESAALVRRLVEAKEREAERMNEINRLEAETVRCWRGGVGAAETRCSTSEFCKRSGWSVTRGLALTLCERMLTAIRVNAQIARAKQEAAALLARAEARAAALAAGAGGPRRSGAGAELVDASLRRLSDAAEEAEQPTTLLKRWDRGLADRRVVCGSRAVSLGPAGPAV